MPVNYITEAEPQRLHKLASYAGPLGFDTETYGHNVRETSPAYRAKLDLISVAYLTSELHPRGYRKARGAVLSPGSLAILKTANPSMWIGHNVRHDLHTFANAGFKLPLPKVVDTLELARQCWPGREGAGGGYGLKSLRPLLGKEPRDGFKDLTAPAVVGCPCGTTGCKKRSKGHVAEHKVPCPIESIVPGHPRWEAKLEYAQEDAVDAIELWDLANRRLRELETKLPELPW